MSVRNFVPEFWSRLLNIQLRKALVGMNATNQDYEGEIRDAGDTVRITRPGSIAVGDYDGTDITLEDPDSTQLTLVIDQAKYAAFIVDDVDAVQANVNLVNTYVQEMNFGLQDTVDQFIFSHYTDADADNVIDAGTVDGDNIYDVLVEAKANLSKQNVPKSGRWAILSPDEIASLEQSDAFQRASDLGDDTSRAGFEGRAVGFNIFESNNLVETTGTPDQRHALYGHSMATTFAMQLTQMEAFRPEKRFADAVKGLLLYGARVIKPEALGVIEVDLA